jgi:hypothetical protein
VIRDEAARDRASVRAGERCGTRLQYPLLRTPPHPPEGHRRSNPSQADRPDALGRVDRLEVDSRLTLVLPS